MAIFNRSRVLGVGAVCLQYGGWAAAARRGVGLTRMDSVYVHGRGRADEPPGWDRAEGNVPDNNRRDEVQSPGDPQSHSTELRITE